MECVSCEVIRSQEEIIKGQSQTILHLQSHITEFEACLDLHSGNSSFPPSRDAFSPQKQGVIMLVLHAEYGTPERGEDVSK